jgi:DEAD/DEAH box helicase domain-containing protein
VLVAGEDQLDQWLMANPDQVFTRPPEPAVINPANPYVLGDQIACAAYELPLTPADHRYWGGLVDEGVRLGVLDGNLRIRPRHRLHPDGPVAVWSGPGQPAPGVGLRSHGGPEVRIVTAAGDLVGTVDAGRATRQVHPGAVYLHQGEPWRVATLDLDHREAVVEPTGATEHTRPRTETDIAITDVDNHGHLGPAGLWLGRVSVRSRVVGYQRIETRSGRVLANEGLDLPAHELDTTAVWFTFPDTVWRAAGITPPQLPGALHALEHTTIGILPLFAICDRSDVGGVSTAMHAGTQMASVFIHDAHPGGAGLADLAFARASELIAAAADVIASCGCALACPSCVQSPKCGNGNEPLDKAGALALARALLA